MPRGCETCLAAAVTSSAVLAERVVSSRISWFLGAHALHERAAMREANQTPMPLGLVIGAGGFGGALGGYVLQVDALLSPLSLTPRSAEVPMSHVPISTHTAMMFILVGMLFAALIAARLVRGQS